MAFPKNFFQENFGPLEDDCDFWGTCFDEKEKEKA